MPGSGVLLDARAAERFRGENEPVDPRAGHIPGRPSALRHPRTSDADGRFLPSMSCDWRSATPRWACSRMSPVGVYCGSGVTAAHDALALTLAGFTPAVYPDRGRSGRTITTAPPGEWPE